MTELDDQDKCEKMRVAQLQFIGKILSLFTHQLNNHLAIIKDSVGFLDDLIKIKGQFKDDISEITNTMIEAEEQIEKATVLSKRLNSFGHRMDNAFSTFSINDILDELLVLASRATIQKRLSFERDFSPDVPPIYSDPSKVHFLLFCLMERFLKRMKPGGCIRVITKAKDQGCTVCFAVEDGICDSEEVWLCSDEVIEYAKSSLGCKTMENNPNSITLFFEGMG